MFSRFELQTPFWFGLSRFWWIVIVSAAVVLLGTVGAVLYFFVFHKKNARYKSMISNANDKTLHPSAPPDTTVIVYAHGILTVRGDPTNLVEGQIVRLVYDGDWTGQDMRYEYTAGASPSKLIKEGVFNTVDWKVAPNLFGAVTFSAIAKSAAPADVVKSRAFNAVPVWSASGPGERPESTVYMNNPAYVQLVTEDRAIFVGAALQLFMGGVKQPALWDGANFRFVWTPIEAALTAQTLEIHTTLLVKCGYPNELSYTMPYPVKVVNTPIPTGPSTTPDFSNLTVIVPNSGATTASFQPGDKVQLNWTSNPLAKGVNVFWTFDANISLESKDWNEFFSHPIGASPQIITLPDTGSNTSITLMVEDSEDSTRRCMCTVSISIGGSWVFGIATNSIVNVTATNSWIVVPITLAGYTKETIDYWRDTSRWSMIVVVADDPSSLKDLSKVSTNNPNNRWLLDSTYGALTFDDNSGNLYFTQENSALPFINDPKYANTYSLDVYMYVAWSPIIGKFPDSDYKIFVDQGTAHTFTLTKFDTTVAVGNSPTLSAQGATFDNLPWPTSS